MASSFPISNYLVPRAPQSLVQQPAREQPAQEKPDENRRTLPEKIPQILDLDAAKQMEKRLALRAQQNVEQGSYSQSQRAVRAYETLAANEERDRVSSMLGIDVFA